MKVNITKTKNTARVSTRGTPARSMKDHGMKENNTAKENLQMKKVYKRWVCGRMELGLDG